MKDWTRKVHREGCLDVMAVLAAGMAGKHLS